MAVQRELVWLGRDNTIDLLLKSDGSAYDLSSATTIAMVFSGVTINSDAQPSWFDWTTSSLTTGQVNVSLGTAGTSIPSGFVYDAKLIVYTSSNTRGIIWGTVPVSVKG
ncbi:MAG: hypothetical protein FVQ80_07055 [Planctomycetes bacterium]|nr:hypothetical protein [Planctomycetota bacterium]